MIVPHTNSTPCAADAVQIARALEKLASEANHLGYARLAESIHSVVIEATEEARHVSLMTY